MTTPGIEVSVRTSPLISLQGPRLLVWLVKLGLPNNFPLASLATWFFGLLFCGVRIGQEGRGNFG